MIHGEKSWTAIIHIVGGEGFGQVHDDESSVIAEVADLGGTVSRIRDHYIARSTRCWPRRRIRPSSTTSARGSLRMFEIPGFRDPLASYPVAPFTSLQNHEIHDEVTQLASVKDSYGSGSQFFELLEGTGRDL